MFAASVVIALVLEIDKTNISRTSAWEMSQNLRLTVVKSIRDTFQCPPKVVDCDREH